MNQACVSLDEVLAAALVRAASLVPETSGYLALAVADATSKLPYAHDDRGVWLTIDGSVMVPRKPALTAPEEAARGLRDLLRRLLAASTGTMPGLAAAARVRGEEVDVERVVGDVEAALIPVNRTAAKRALARLARETLRAKELGKLRKKSAAPAAEKAPATATATREKAATATVEKVVPAKAVIVAEEARTKGIVDAAPATATATATGEKATERGAPAMSVILPPPMVVTPPPSIVAEMALLEKAPAVLEAPPMPIAVEPPALVMRAITPAPIEVEVEMSPEPNAIAAAPGGSIEWENGDATIADPEAMAVIEASYRERELALEAPDLDAPTVVPVESVVTPVRDEDSFTQPWRGRSMQIASAPAGGGEGLNTKTNAAADAGAKGAIAAAPKARESSREAITAEPALLAQLAGSRADELLGAFHAEDEGDPAVLAAASSLRELTGVDEPSVRREPQRPSYLRPPQVARKAPSLAGLDDDEILPLPAPRSVKPAASRWPFALFAVGVLVLFAAWLYRPTLAHDFFGLRKLVSPEASPPAAAPASTDDGAPDPAVDATPAAPSRPRDTHAASGSGDGARRRRD